MDRENYYSVNSVKKMSQRTWAAAYETPFTFNITVNDMVEVQAHKPTKYQFIGNPIHDLSDMTYMSSSAPDRRCKVAQVRSARG